MDDVTKKELSDPEEIEATKAKMRQFAKADRKMRKEAKHSRLGCGPGFVKFALFACLVSGIGYGIYLWHPWGHQSITHERALPDCDGNGYVTTTTFQVLGIPLRETESTICSE